MGFRIGEHTERLIKNVVKMNLFAGLAGSSSPPATGPGVPAKAQTRLGYRIFLELKILFSEAEPLAAIRRLGHFQLLKLLHPALEIDPALEKIIAATQQAVAWYRLLYQDEPFQTWLVFMLALTCRLNGRQRGIFYRRLEIPERYMELLGREKSQANQLLRTLKRHPTLKASEAYRLMGRLAPEGLIFLMGFSSREETKKAISLFITYQRHVKTFLKGADLRALGYAAGPIYRRILDRLLYARLDNEVDSREDELTFLKNHYPPSRYRTGGRPKQG
jgi:tRNA nucleotidyltransferase (CCA-adding enzyme)